MTDQELLDLAAQCGFDHAGALNVAAMRFDPAVRDMCAADRCRSYGRCWTCPPGCGTLGRLEREMKGYARGLLVQTTAPLEDEFDAAGMEQARTRHRRSFEALVRCLRRFGQQDCLPLTAGACRVCLSCTYPGAPCRFPQKRMASMEACGLLVSEVCSRSGLGYFYGTGTVTYTSCVLLRR